jgi:ketosteroid isomerase-like protein
MSEQNVEIVRRGFEAYDLRDVDRFLSFLHPEFELHSAIVGGAERRVYRGHDGVRKWLEDSDESFEELRIEPTEFRDLGDQVLVFGRIHAQGRESGVELDSPTGWLITVRDAKLVKAQGFLSEAQALEAAEARD